MFTYLYACDPKCSGACRALQRLYLRSACLRDSGVHELVAALQASTVGEKLQVRQCFWWWYVDSYLSPFPRRPNHTA